MKGKLVFLSLVLIFVSGCDTKFYDNRTYFPGLDIELEQMDGWMQADKANEELWEWEIELNNDDGQDVLIFNKDKNASICIYKMSFEDYMDEMQEIMSEETEDDVYESMKKLYENTVESVAGYGRRCAAIGLESEYNERDWLEYFVWQDERIIVCFYTITDGYVCSANARIDRSSLDDDEAETIIEEIEETVKSICVNND